MAAGLLVTWPPPFPILSSVLAGTLVTSDTTLASAEPVGPFEAVFVPVLLPGLTTMMTTTIAPTARMAPAAMRIRRRFSARRSAARWAASLSLRLESTFVLLALPMLASSNPCVSQPAVTPYLRWFQIPAPGAQEWPVVPGTGLYVRRSTLPVRPCYETPPPRFRGRAARLRCPVARAVRLGGVSEVSAKII